MDALNEITGLDPVSVEQSHRAVWGTPVLRVASLDRTEFGGEVQSSDGCFSSDNPPS